MAKHFVALFAPYNVTIAQTQIQHALGSLGFLCRSTLLDPYLYQALFIDVLQANSDIAGAPYITECGDEQWLYGDLCLENGERLSQQYETPYHSDRQLTEALYPRVGSQICQLLQGDFACLGWNNKTRELHVGRDVMQMRTLYYTELSGLVAVATKAEFLTHLSGYQPRPSLAGLASWLNGTPNPDLSVHEQIKLLPAGHQLSYHPGGSVEISSCQSLYSGHEIRYKDEKEYEAHFYELFNLSVKSRLAGSTQIASQMSGGMDSTSVTALAQHILKPRHLELLPVSHRYNNAQKCDESGNIEAMLHKLKPASNLLLDVDEARYRDFLNLYPTDFSNPGIVLSPRYQDELKAIRAAGANLLLTGNGGDEVCWGFHTTYRERLQQGEAGVIPEVYRAARQCGEPGLSTVFNVLFKPLIPQGLKAMLGGSRHSETDSISPGWLSAQAKELVQQACRPENPFHARKQSSLYARYYGLKLSSTYNAVRSYATLSDHYGIEIRHPFFSQQLADFSFSIPQKMLIRGPYPKWLLRRSMDHLLPHEVCWNIKKTTFDQHFGNLVRENQQQLRPILADRRLEEMGLIDTSRLLNEFDSVVSSSNAPLKVELLYAILTQIWLQQHF